MTRRKSKRFNMPRKCAVPTLIEQAFLASIRLIVNSVNNMVKYIDILHAVDLQVTIAKIMLIGQEIKEYFNLLIPRTIQNDISIFCLKTLHIENTHLDYIYNTLIQIIAKTIFNARSMRVMSWVDITRKREIPVNVELLFVKHFPCMSQLQVLNLKGYGYDETPVIKLLSEGLVSMVHLEKFAWEFSSDSIIEKIALNCKKIQKIDAISARQVTNACIPALCMCEQLKEFQFQDSNIDAWGYENLLIKHPRLETVDLIYLLHLQNMTLREIGKLLHFRESSILCNGLQTLNMENVRKLSSAHPHITTLYIKADKHLNILPLFPNVINVFIENYIRSNEHFNDFHDAMKLIGSRIKSLHFADGIIDMQTLFIINKYCSNLITLKMDFFYIFWGVMPIEELLVMKFESFRSITEIRITGYPRATVATRQFLTNLLSYCTNVKFIVIEGFDLDDEIMEQVISSNPMKELEYLKIIGHTHLTMKSVDLLMKHCDNLRYLQSLEQWNIDSRDLDNFREHLKNNNINVITEKYNIQNAHEIRDIYRIDKLYMLQRKQFKIMYKFYS